MGLRSEYFQKTMTTIINIETSKYQRSTAFRWVFVLACLLVTVSLQSCRTAAISATALDLNNYQTGKTLPKGKIAASIQAAAVPSVVAGVAYNATVSQSISGSTVTAILSLEANLTDGLDAGVAGQFSTTTFFLDGDAGCKGFIKTALTNPQSPIAASLMMNGGVLWGAQSSLSGIYVPRDFFGYPLVKTDFTINRSIQSQLNRIGIAVPISWAAQHNAIALSGTSSLSLDMDIVITPAVHLVNQNATVQDEFSYALREFHKTYIIPSLSFGLNYNTSPVHFFPEITVGWANKNLTIGLGVCIRSVEKIF